MSQFVDRTTPTELILGGAHDPLLVALSFLVAWLAALAAMILLERIRSAETRQRRGGWLAMGAVMLGVGIWSLHFIGMLALELPVPINFGAGITLASMLPAMGGSAVALWILSRDQDNHLQPLVGGTVFGLGVGTMHYMGMAAIEGNVQLAYDPAIFTASLLVSTGLGILAIYAYLLSSPQPGSFTWRNLSVAGIVALAISGMHYTAMHAAVFTAAIDLHSSTSTSSNWLVHIVVAGTAIVTVGTLAAIALDRRLESESLYRDMSREQLLEIIDAIRDGIVLLDENDRILLSNRALTSITGYSQAELLGRPIQTVQYADDPQAVIEEVAAGVASTGSWQGELAGRRKDGSVIPIRVTASRVHYNRSPESHYIATVADISEQKAAAESIHYLAFHDTLTGLPNRRQLNKLLQQLQIHGDSDYALVLLDVDNFKALNDSLGHHKGDELLRRIAKRLQAHGQERHLARLGGNEFAVIVDHLPCSDEDGKAHTHLRLQVEALRTALEQDYNLSGNRYSCKFSIGIARASEAGHDSDKLVAGAGLALHQAKLDGGDRDHWFAPELAAAVTDRLALEADLRLAIEGNELKMYLQPQIEADGDVIGAEALARWQHPSRGNIPPNEFIPLAENTGLITMLGSWVLEQACRELAEWARQPELADLHLAVNVSARQFQHPLFAEELLALLDRHEIPRGRLVLEITESLLMEDVDTTIATMQMLKAQGLGFSLDDFGTGYSSLAYLKQLPFDSLKIDVSFVQDLPHDSNSAAIVRTIISLAEVLQLRVVAEGVEREAQQTFLLAHGCHTFQGFLFARPQPPETFRTFVMRNIRRQKEAS